MICALSWALAGRRAALLAIVSFVGMWALGTWLNPAMARPRPVPPLVQVVGSPRGYSFPSSFALTYASTWGFLAILAAVKATGPVRLALVIFCSVLLLAGGVARIALGAHWPSDIVISYFLGLLWAAGLIRFLAKA
ncbi:MAG: phosphatase PAP2 family protein [Thermodesulfobacteriota bacterium]